MTAQPLTDRRSPTTAELRAWYLRRLRPSSRSPSESELSVRRRLVRSTKRCESWSTCQGVVHAAPLTAARPSRSRARRRRPDRALRGVRPNRRRDDERRRPLLTTDDHDKTSSPGERDSVEGGRWGEPLEGKPAQPCRSLRRCRARDQAMGDRPRCRRRARRRHGSRRAPLPAGARICRWRGGGRAWDAPARQRRPSRLRA